MNWFVTYNNRPRLVSSGVGPAPLEPNELNAARPKLLATIEGLEEEAEDEKRKVDAELSVVTKSFSDILAKIKSDSEATFMETNFEESPPTLEIEFETKAAEPAPESGLPDKPVQSSQVGQYNTSEHSSDTENSCSLELVFDSLKNQFYDPMTGKYYDLEDSDVD